MKTKTVLVALLAASLAGNSAINAADKAYPPQPVPGTRMSEAYVQQIGRFAYLWAWPMVNMHNRRLLLQKRPSRD